MINELKLITDSQNHSQDIRLLIIVLVAVVVLAIIAIYEKLNRED